MTHSPLADVLTRRIASLSDPAVRVARLRTLLPAYPVDELRQAFQTLVERTGMRDSAAQVTLLAWSEAAGVDRLGADALEDEAPTRTATYQADWGTGRPLTLGERKNLARRPDRQLLERALADGHPDVVAELLRNPRLTEADVARLCSAKNARAEVLVRVFASPRWAIRGAVRRAIACNPRSPVEISLALVPMLSRDELREVAGDGRLHRRARARALEVLRRLPPTPTPDDDAPAH